MLPGMNGDCFSVEVCCACLKSVATADISDNRESDYSVRSQASISRRPVRPRGVSHPSQLPGYALLRLIWIAVGPVLMLVLLILKMESGTHSTVRLDIAFCAVTVGIRTIRWLTWLAGDKYSSFGRKAFLQSLLSFTMRFVLLACGAWILAALVAAQRGLTAQPQVQSDDFGSGRNVHQAALTSVEIL